MSLTSEILRIASVWHVKMRRSVDIALADSLITYEKSKTTITSSMTCSRQTIRKMRENSEIYDEAGRVCLCILLCYINRLLVLGLRVEKGGRASQC